MWLALALLAAAQDDDVWQSPPEPIASVLDAPALPAVTWAPDRQRLAILDRPGLPPLAERAVPVVKVAGIRIDPRTWGPARATGYTGLSVQVPGQDPVAVPVPAGARLRDLRWHPDGERLFVTNTTDEGVALWLVDVVAGTSRPLTPPILNATYGNPCDWLPGDAGLICKVRPSDAPPPEPPAVPAGPIVEENLGRVAPARTYADLLQTPHDEALFAYYLTSALDHVALDGTRTRLVGAAMIDEATPSPDGRVVLLETFHRPFSTQVPASRFPKRVDLLVWESRRIVGVVDLPLADDVPTTFGSVRRGPRRFQWRADAPSTLVWFEAQDGGDAGVEAELRDAIFAMDVANGGRPQRLWAGALRLSDITWGDDDLALVEEWWWNTRTVRTWAIAPGDPDAEPRLVDERDWQDRYADPGSPLLVPGPFGRRVLRQVDGDLLLAGDGASPEGVYPFLDRLDLDTMQTTRLWQASGQAYERVLDVRGEDAAELITVRQTPEAPPNHALRTGRRYRRVRPVTTFADPLPMFAEVAREELTYTREDGVPLTATLYTPPGWTPDDGPLPTLVWAYPREFKSKDSAGQKTKSDHRYTRPSRTSPLWLTLRGYAVLADPAMPIVGEGDAEPNDTYVDQLVAGARAAVKAVVDRGVADPARVAIGGHSYGAFTAANLLAHSDLFACGIARSGAYNRSLTPFGFQGEQRTYWESTDTYLTMSPFTWAPAIDEPLLLIHGAEDSNSGTWPMQSERMYEAMRGLGGTVRYVVLPFEDHGYAARESVGHVLWEMDRWLATRCARQ